MGKLIIRHCKNCQWHKPFLGLAGDCEVKYITCFKPRLRAWLCRFYKQREEQWPEKEK